MLIFLFLLGLIIGSFLNVVALRFESGETLGGRSHCPRCHALIHWYDNIPLLSWIVLQGRCRQCHEAIAWQYPLVELGTGLAFLGMGVWGQPVLTRLVNAYVWSGSFDGWSVLLLLAGYFVLISLLIVIFITDLRTMEIPLVCLLSAVGVSLALVVWGAWGIDVDQWPELVPLVWQSQLLGGLIATLCFSALVYCSKETWMGKGDIWLAAVLGLMVGVELLLFALTLSFFLGALVGIGLLAFASKGWKSQIAFAPFLIIALGLTWGIRWLQPDWLTLFLLPIRF